MTTGRPRKYFTEEERKAAKLQQSREYIKKPITDEQRARYYANTNARRRGEMPPFRKNPKFTKEELKERNKIACIAYRNKMLKVPGWKERKKQNDAISMRKDIRKYLWKSARTSSTRRGVVFDIVLEDMPQLPEFCPITHLKLESYIGKGGKKKNSYSLDRIDNSKGYIKGNVAIISFHANQCKSCLSLEEIERLFKYTYDHTHSN